MVDTKLKSNKKLAITKIEIANNAKSNKLTKW